MKRERKIWWRWFGAFAGLLVVFAAINYWPVDSSITVSHDTTRITTHIRPDGTPDYVAWLNEEYGRGVTPENNAAVVLLEVLGTDRMLAAEVQYDVLARLGAPPSLAGMPGSFVDFYDFARARAAAMPPPAPATAPASTPTTFPGGPTGPAGWRMPGPVSEEERLNDIYEQAQEQVLWRAEDWPELAEWLKKNESALDRAVEASRREKYFIPLVRETPNDSMIACLLPSLGGYRSLARALILRAGMRFEAGHRMQAWEDVLACHRFARLTAQGPSIIQHLVGIAIDALATNATTRFATSGKLSAEEARRMLAGLEALPPMQNMAEAMDLERLSLLDYMILLGKGKLKEENLDAGVGGRVGPFSTDAWIPGRLDIDESLRTCNVLYDGMVAALREPDPAKRQAAIGAFWAAWEPRLNAVRPKELLLSAAGGRLTRRQFSRNYTFAVMRMLVPTVSRAFVLSDKAKMQLELAKLSLALAAYKAEKGEYPAKLADLTPNYIKAAPKDIFSGSPVQYRRTAEGYVLWSVGDDLTDDGGAMEDPNGWIDSRPDIVVQVK